MQNIYQVENSYHLMEGLDSEFLVIASSVPEIIRFKYNQEWLII